MVSKSYRIGYNFQRRVVKHLSEKGFNCIVQPKSAFPDIIAWKPFIDGNGRTLAINTQTRIGDKSYQDIMIPFYVSLIECKVNKYLNKKEKDATKQILEEGRCNSFFVAYRDKRKLEFEEFKLKKAKIERIEKVEAPFYVA